MITKIEQRAEDGRSHPKLSILNEARSTLSGPRYLHQLVASSNPDTIAIDHLSAENTRRTISYGQLNNYADALSGILRNHITSRSRQCIVPVVMPQCPELYIAYQAILKTGAGFCPVLPDVPLERLKFIVGDVEAVVVLSTVEVRPDLSSALSNITVLEVSLPQLESQEAFHANAASTPPDGFRQTPDDIAYVMYTSGSTGLPKGVRIPHFSVTQSLLAHDEHIPPFKRFLQFASPTFDVSVFEIFFPLFRGATLVSCERERMLADLPGTIEMLQIDAAELTPTVAGTLLRSRAAAQSLRILLTIGEMLNQRVVEEFGGSEFRESMLFAMYGPTEAAIHCTLAPCLSADSSVRNIGIPLSTVTAFILSEDVSQGPAQILPFGETGELAVAGQLADGYLNRPEQTLAAFIDMPGYGAVYRTGDRAMMLTDNTIQILGRISAGQVKLRGQRVELGEIEETVCKTTGLELAIASAIDDSLVVFCSGRPDLEVGTIQATCKAWLPRYMRPNDIVILRQGVPRLPSGKVDRRKLVDDYKARREEVQDPIQEHWDEIEQKVADVIADELDSSITSRTLLWTSGLDSLKSIKVAAALRYSFPQITVAMLLRSETIADVASQIKAATHPTTSRPSNQVSSNSSVLHKIEEDVRHNFVPEHPMEQLEAVLPCNPIQIAMLTETLSSGELNFNTIEVHYSPGIDEAGLRSALEQVAAQNRILRSGFMQTNVSDEPFVQLVWNRLVLDQAISLRHPLAIETHPDTHTAIIRIHHALYDGWSWDLIVADINRSLAGSILPTRPQFGEYIDFARQQKAINYDRDKDYWQRALDGARPCQVPNLSPVRSASRMRGVRQRILTTKALEWSNIAQTSRLSRQTILQAAMLLLLSTYCDTTDVICGIVSSGRERPFPQIDQLMGPCLSTYPMRVDMTKVETVIDLLQYVQRLNTMQLEHGSLSLGEIYQAASVPANSRLFDTMCVWQEGLDHADENLDLVRTGTTRDALDYSLILEGGLEGDRIWARLTFEEARIPGDHAMLFLNQLDQVISSMVASTRSILTQIWTGMDDTFLSISNTDFQPLVDSFDLGVAIKKLAIEDPERIAVQFVEHFDITTSRHECTNLTYKSLYESSAKVAHHLTSCYDANPDDLICIMLEKSTELYVMILAAILAGTGYLCIDPKTPDQRISHILREAKCRVFITDQKDRVKGMVGDATSLVECSDLLSKPTNKIHETRKNIPEDALAYAVFTSGSTGTPKGVLITRKNLASNIRHLASIYPHNTGDKLLQSCSQAFDVSVFEIFWTWHVGLTLCSAKNDILFRDLEAFIRSLEVTHLSMTPSVAALVDPTKVPDVKFLVTAGEPMNPKVFDSWADNGLYQGYGPSETTNICNVRPKVSNSDFINNVGPAFDNTSIFVCSRQSKATVGQDGSIATSVNLTFMPLPQGAVGEIWVGGDQVGRGYIDPVLTARSWLDHQHYGRLYRSGDMGRLLADGSLVILGREDDQVKLRGLRIELGEINSALVRHAKVKDAATLVVERGSRAQLMSLCVLYGRQGGVVEDGDIRDIFSWLEENLTDYMIPDTIIPVEHIPLTRQGKIDSRMLRAHAEKLDHQQFLLYSRGYEQSSDKEQFSELESQIAKALSDHTGFPVEQISRNTSFYSMGIDSIKSIAFAQSLRKHGFGHVDISTILKNPSIRRLAPHLKAERCDPDRQTDYTFEDSFDVSWREALVARYEQKGFQVARVMPCTPLQEVMLSSVATHSSDAYRNSLRWKVHCDVEELHHAWKRMATRHELLRTAFVETDNPERPFAQVVLANFELPWSLNGRHQTTEVTEEHALALPPYSFQVQDHQGQSEASLSLSIHHALYDADAMSVLLTEVENTIRKQELSHPPLFASYIDYMANMDLEETDRYWKELLGEISPSRLGELVAETEGHHPSAGMHTAQLTSKFSLHYLEACAKVDSSTALTIFQAALARLISLYTGSSDVCFGTVLSGRTLSIPDVQQMVGPCFNTLPVRTKLDKRLSIRELANDLHQQTIDMLPLQPSSLRRIQRLNSPDGRALFDVLLLLQQGVSTLDEQIWTLEEDRGDMSFPFIIEIMPSQPRNQIELKLHYQSCDASMAANILEHFDSLIEHTARYSQATALNFDMIDGALPIPKQSIQSTQVPNQTTLPRVMTTMESEVLKIMADLSSQNPQSVNPSTTIFKFGLDSINAIQLANRLRQQGYDIKATDILEGPTIQDIAKHCQEHTDDRSTSLDSGILRSFDQKFSNQILQQWSDPEHEVEDVLPCTPSQSGILSQFVGSQGALYYNRIRLAINQNVDLDRLRESWRKAVEIHEMLRAGFIELDHAIYPFAMIVYHAHAYDVPWHEGGTDEGLDAVERGSRKLKELARPPWELVIHHTSQSTFLDLWMLHALYDAYSIQRILADVAAIYENEVPTAACPLRPVVSQILTVAQDASRAQSFWTDVGGDLQATKFPDLSVYRKPPARLVGESIRSCFNMSTIRARCSELEVSFQTICQAAWSRILAAYCGQSHVAFGVILSGRMFEDSQSNEAVFPCINTVPFAIEVVSDDNELLSKVSQRGAGVAKFQHTSLTAIKRWNEITIDPFDTVLVLQQFENSAVDADLWNITEDEASGEYTVSLEILPTEDYCTLQLTYRPDIIPSAQATIIMKEFDDTVGRLLQVEKESRGKADGDMLSVLPPKDEKIPTSTRFLHEFVETTAHKHRSSIALEFVSNLEDDHVDKQEWTYSELDARGNQIANALIQKGAKVGDLIAVSFDKCPEASFAILGVLKAGCAYVAIDPGAPEARKQFILHDAKCSLVLTTSHKAELFVNSKIEVILADDRKELESVPSTKPSLKDQLTPEHSSYCLYTSGTTGTPKGCLISHSSAVQAILSFSRIFQGRWAKSSRWLQFASFHFDVSVLEQYWSWSVGICMTSAPRDLLFEDLPGNINKLGITHLDLTPSLAKLLTPETVPSLCDGVFIVGGEQVQQEILDTWGDTGCLYNFYGPSEVTIGCTVHPQVQKSTRPTNIGQQWDNVGSFVLDPQSQQPVIRGAVGELCLSGPLVGKGYLNRPELTEQKFVTLAEHNVRIYRTGDLVRLLHDDSFDFLGRIDGQVKLRGQRLEVGEIDHVIIQASSRIKEVSTIVLKHPQQDKEHLVSFFAIARSRQPGGTPPQVIHDQLATDLAEDIRKQCSSRLPSYMVPTYFICVDFMPLSGNNKIDTKMLASIYGQATFSSIQSRTHLDEADSNEISGEIHRLASILSKFLDIEKTAIKPESRLFELGLDSISVIGLSRILKREGFQSADVSTIMRNSVVASLAKAIKSGSPIADDSLSLEVTKSELASFAAKHRMSVAETLGVDPEDVGNVVPSTPLQLGMISKVVGSSSSNTPYFAFFSYRLQSGISVQKLHQAWKAITCKLGILRTRFVSTEDGYAQVILTKPKLSTLFLTGDNDEQDVRYAFDNWTQASRTFGRSLPWQLCFAEHNRYTSMTLFLFHGLYDGISLPLLLDAVKTEYLCQQSLPEDELIQFHDFLPFGPLSKPRGAKEFWVEELRQFNHLNIQDDSLGQPQVVKLFETVRDDKIGPLCSHLNVTTPALFHAVWLYTLFAHFKVNPTLGLVLSGRTIGLEGAETVIGPLFNTIPCSISKLPASSTVHDLAKSCHDFNMKAIPYQHSSIRDITKWLGRNSTEGLFDSLFVFQKTDSVDAVDTEPLWTQMNSSGSPDYALNLEIEQASNGKDFNITLLALQSNKLRESTIASLFKSLKQNMAGLAGGENFTLPEGFFTNASRNSGQVVSRNVSEMQLEPLDDGAWTDKKITIRDELATLSGASLETIHLSSPSIFELGLDSIDALKLAARLKKRGLNVAVSKIMRNPTVTGIAAKCQRTARTENGATEEVSVEGQQKTWYKALSQQGTEAAKDEMILPVTPMQEGLLLDHSIYYHVLPYILSAETESHKLVDAIIRVFDAELALQARFLAVEDTSIRENFLQVFTSDSASKVCQPVIGTEHDLSAVMHKMKQEAISEGLAGQYPRITMVSAGEGGPAFLLLGLPHAMYDGWSLGVLHSKIASSYHDMEHSGTSMALVISYLDEVLKQSTRKTSGEFWNKLLQGCPSSQFSLSPGPQDRKAILIDRPSNIARGSIQKLCREAGITMQSLGLACWAISLAYNTKISDVVHGLVLSGRTTEGAESLAFPTFNTVIFRAKIEKDASSTDFLRNVHKVSLDVSEHQHFPLKESLRLAGASSTQRFNTLFTFQKVFKQTDQTPQLYHEYDLGDTAINPPYGVNIEMTEKNGQLWWTCAVQDDVASNSEVQAIVDQLDQILEYFIDHPDRPVIELSKEGEVLCGLDPIKLKHNVDVPIPTGHINVDLTDADEEWSDVELAIQSVLSQISQVDKQQIQKNTGIFHLGLDSISAIKVSGQLRKQGIKLSVSEAIRAQTVKKMAERAVKKNLLTLGTSQQTSKSIAKISGQITSVLKIPDSSIEHILPAAAGQVYMLDAWKASQGRLFYADFWFEAQGVTKDTFESAFEQLSTAVPAFRTTFVEWDGVTYSVTLKAQEASAYQYPWSMKSIQGGNRVLAKLHIHHALYDAVGLHIMVDTLTQLCRNSGGNLKLNTNFEPFLHLTRNMSQAATDTRRKFWTTYLNRPGDQDQGILKGQFSSTRTEKFLPSLMPSSDLRPILKKLGISLQTLFFAAYAQVHAEIQGKASNAGILPDSVILGTYMANRFLDVEHIDSLVAPTFNILPIKIATSAGMSLVEAARQIQHDLQEISRPEHCGTSLRDIHEWTALRLDGYMNFLRLPDDNEDQHVDEGNEIKVTHAEGQSLYDAQSTMRDEAKLIFASSESDDTEHDGHTDRSADPSPYILDNTSTPETPSRSTAGPHTYIVPAIDVEARIMPDGHLAMGVFAPGDILDATSATQVMHRVKALLESITSS